MNVVKTIIAATVAFVGAVILGAGLTVVSLASFFPRAIAEQKACTQFGTITGDLEYIESNGQWWVRYANASEWYILRGYDEC